MRKKVVRCALQENKPIFENECLLKKGQLKSDRKCQSCNLFGSPKSNPKRKKEKPLETLNEAAGIKKGRWFSHPTSIAGDQKAFEEHYEEDNNPLHLMHAFNHAVEYGIAIPQWVQNRIYQAFDLYMSGNNSSLDVLLGCKKRGRGTVKERFETRGRNVELMTAMDMLIRQGMSIEDAAEVAHEYINKQGNYSPNCGKLSKMYYSKGKKQLQAVHEYPPMWSQKVLRSAPEAIQEKYPNIFNFNSDSYGSTTN